MLHGTRRHADLETPSVDGQRLLVDHRPFLCNLALLFVLGHVQPPIIMSHRIGNGLDVVWMAVLHDFFDHCVERSLTIFLVMLSPRFLQMPNNLHGCSLVVCRLEAGYLHATLDPGAQPQQPAQISLPQVISRDGVQVAVECLDQSPETLQRKLDDKRRGRREHLRIGSQFLFLRYAPHGLNIGRRAIAAVSVRLIGPWLNCLCWGWTASAGHLTS